MFCCLHGCLTIPQSTATRLLGVLSIASVFDEARFNIGKYSVGRTRWNLRSLPATHASQGKRECSGFQVFCWTVMPFTLEWMVRSISGLAHASRRCQRSAEGVIGLGRRMVTGLRMRVESGRFVMVGGSYGSFEWRKTERYEDRDGWWGLMGVTVRIMCACSMLNVYVPPSDRCSAGLWMSAVNWCPARRVCIAPIRLVLESEGGIARVWGMMMWTLSPSSIVINP